MLFHWLRDRNSGTDIEQIVAELPERVDPARLQSSWQRAVDDFAMLRTAFLWDGRESPAQYIVAAAAVPFSVHDLRAVPQSDRAARAHQFIRDDRREGFDLSAAPAMRVSLLQLDDERFSMVWTFHHILIDGRSFETILDRVFAAYDGPAPGGEWDNAPVERAYREYADWVATQDVRAAREFWRDKLSGFTATTPLPHVDQIEASSETFAEARAGLSRPVSDGLRALAAREQLSLNSLVISAWALLLARHSGEPEVVFGVTKTTRRGTIPDADAIVGLFLATIPVRIAVDPEATVTEWLRRVREEWVSLRGREHVPLVDIKQASALPPSASLFDSFIMFENYELGERLRSKGGAWARRSVTLLEQPGYPLALMAYGGDTVSLKLDYDTRRFDHESAARLLAQLATVLGAWSSTTEGRVWQVPMLSDAERQRILHEWNRTEKTYDRDKNLAALIEDQVRAGPSRVAISFGDEHVTYAEMNERANRLANELIRRGVGPDSLVGVCLERTPDLLVSLVAVVKSGGAYVPLDPGFPRDRLLYMAEDAELRAVVTQAPFDRMFADSGADVLLVDATRNSDTSAENPSVDVGPEHLAYVLYTSGSTGRPKGVEVTRGGFLNLVASMRDLPGMTAEDSIVALTTVSFDIAGVETLVPLALGARIILATRETALNPEALRALIERTSPTIVQATPVTFKMLFEAGWRGDGKVKTICGGEPISVDLGASLSAACGEAWNGYGPTETTVYSAFHHIRRGDRIIYIGRPPANSTTYILDAHRCPVPQGATGELYIGGDGVARGYRKRPELTAEKFLADPFRPGERVYRTGDLARYSRGGVIECLGRTDHQVKIRGFRIELGEIESLLKAQPGIRDAVVIAREDTPGEKRLVAYLIADVLDPSTLRAALKVNLPDYMLPAAFVQLDRMPTTPSGKVDRRALPVPSGGAVSAERAIVAPRTYVEQGLAEVWAEVFEIPRVGVDDSFWDLGGHSMLAVRLMSRISQTFGKRIPLNTLFESPTIGQLAKHVEDERAVQGRHTLVSIRAAGSRPPVYWIPGGAALGMFSLQHLVPALDDDVPVYGLGSAFPDTIDDIERVEERAAQYLALIRRFQPHGPYYFAGYCAGGIIAYEMAQQLLRDGERVAFLGMINCLLPGVPSGRVETIRFKAQRLMYQLGEARREGGGVIQFFRDRQRALRAGRIEQQEISSAVEQAKREGFKDTDKNDYRVVLDATTKVITQYRPRPYPGPVALFVSDDPSLRGVADDLDPRLAWNRVAARSDVYGCDGNHESVLALPHVLSLAAALRTAIDAASNDSAPGESRAAR
jgi:amino acid adenylation domain-containing protein